MADSSFTFFRNTKVHSALPAGVRSNVSEVSVDGAGKNMFATGNWWAARSTNGGNAWSYINPYSGMSDFCCDQIVYYDPARNLLLWLRMGTPSSGWYYRISASTNNGASWTNYTFDPGQHPGHETYDLQYDYPHWKATNDYIYLTTNIFSEWTGGWYATRVMKISLDNFRDKVTVTWSYYDESTYFNATPVHGALDTMYIGTHLSTTGMRVAVWQEDSGSVAFVNVAIPAWTATNRGDAKCTATGSKNFGGRTDDRILAGYYRDGHYEGQPNPVVTFFWNVQEGGSFPYPYVEAYTINTSTWTQVRRPVLWNSNGCFLYPTIAVNARGQLGLVFNHSPNERPNLCATLWDDYSTTPPGWSFYTIDTSAYKPDDNKWGDYNTVYPNHPAGLVWHGGGHVLNSSGTCCNAQIRFFVFGRGRDQNSWDFWRAK
jgi:hypothetical protein